MEISHKEFITVLNEKDTYKKMKENVKIMKSTNELNKEKGKKIKATELQMVYTSNDFNWLEDLCI